jgi:hypothetical protein
MSRPFIGTLCQIAGLAALLAATVIAINILHTLPSRSDWPRPQRITCANNLKQIGLALRTWAIDHEGQFPFNRSTNDGGTMELCARGSDGFDRNAAIHFKVMSNELSTPMILLCPRDRKPKPARDFAQLRGENLTYRMRSGTNMTSAHPEGQLLKCPIDGNVLHCDGSVTEMAAEPQTGRADIINLLEFNARFRSRAVEAIASALLGCGLLFCGRHLRSKSSQA